MIYHIYIYIRLTNKFYVIDETGLNNLLESLCYLHILFVVLLSLPLYRDSLGDLAAHLPLLIVATLLVLIVAGPAVTIADRHLNLLATPSHLSSAHLLGAHRRRVEVRVGADAATVSTA